MVESAAAREKETAFHGILFEGPDSPSGGAEEGRPAFFSDLYLDRVIDAVLAGREEYGLEPFFHAKLDGRDAILYRQEVFRDLEEKALHEAVTAFTQRMRALRRHLAMIDKLHYKRLKQGWFVEVVDAYCEAVRDLARDLAALEVGSLGFNALRAYLSAYVDSPAFIALCVETEEMKEELSRVSYCVHIKGSRVKVLRYEGEADYSSEVLRIFERFKQGEGEDYRVDFRDGPSMNHVEAAILDRVALLFEGVFSRLEGYCERHRGFLDRVVSDFDREVQFYLGYLEFIAPLKAAGLAFCYPELSEGPGEIFARDAFDLALAAKLVPEGSRVVVNGFHLKGRERVIVVTGPNQGGKTTFARMFGQLHYLCGIGCPVPGKEARLLLYDRLFTHFEREEDFENPLGKLEDDLVRMGEIFGEATSASVMVINEIFASTTLHDAFFLGKKMMERIVRLGALCVLVTFVEELTRLDDSIVSMVSMVEPENPAKRTFKIERRPADGLAYAAALADKYGLTYQRLKERMAP